jgi:hypothetical protein
MLQIRNRDRTGSHLGAGAGAAEQLLILHYSTKKRQLTMELEPHRFSLPRPEPHLIDAAPI